MPRLDPPLSIHRCMQWRIQGGDRGEGGGGCLAIFRRVDDVTRAMSKGGACECLHPPPSGNPVSAPGVHVCILYVLMYVCMYECICLQKPLLYLLTVCGCGYLYSLFSGSDITSISVVTLVTYPGVVLSAFTPLDVTIGSTRSLDLEVARASSVLPPPGRLVELMGVCVVMFMLPSLALFTMLPRDFPPAIT